MIQQGFIDYLFTIYGYQTGTANSYIQAIRIIDRMFLYDDVFNLCGKSITTINNYDLLIRIDEFIRIQQSLFKKGESSIFRNISTGQHSYPGKGFCAAAVKQLLNYFEYQLCEIKAWDLLKTKSKAKAIAKDLITLFKIDKEGKDISSTTRVRLGQSYFRKMILFNYENRCCITGLNIPQTLRASHITSWSSDKTNRMNPENGLCLSATYDAAFDKHLLSLDEDYRIIVSKEIKDYYTKDVTKAYFQQYEGKRIILPSLYLPSKKLLEKHRVLMSV